MSNVPVLAEIVRLFEAGDREAVAAFAHPDVVVQDIGGGDAIGPAGVREMLAKWPDPSRTWRGVDLQLSDFGNDVLVSGRLESTSRFGAPISLPVSWLFSFADGKVTRVRWHRPDTDEGEAGSDAS